MQISKIWHIGHSNVVTLTKDILKKAQIKNGDNVSISSPCIGSILIKSCTFKHTLPTQKEGETNENS